MADALLATPALPKTDPALLAEQAKNKKNTHQAAQKFEAMFMNEMMSYMFQGLETDSPFGGGRGEEVFRSLMVEQYSQKIADSGQTKITDMMQKEMLRMQEEQKNPNKPIAMEAPHDNARA